MWVKLISIAFSMSTTAFVVSPALGLLPGDLESKPLQLSVGNSPINFKLNT